MSENRPKRILNGLQFNVAQLLKEATGATRSYNVQASAIVDLGEEIEFVSPIVGHIKLLHAGSNILVTGQLEATVQKTCARCLAPFTVFLSVALEEEFNPTIDVLSGASLPTNSEVEEANQIDEQHILDLTEVLRQEFLVESDSFLYCRPDCKGLCPYCGQDRNINPCHCQDEAIDPRWQGLQAFLQTED